MYPEKPIQALRGRWPSKGYLGRYRANGAGSIGESLLAKTAFQTPVGRRSSCLKKTISKLKVTSNLDVFVQKCRYLLVQTRF